MYKKLSGAKELAETSVNEAGYVPNNVSLHLLCTVTVFDCCEQYIPAKSSVNSCTIYSIFCF